MVEIKRAEDIFEDAWTLYRDALETLDRGEIRNAAEKAWGATKRATDALILARTGRDPRTAGQTVRALRSMGRVDERLQPLVLIYGARAQYLHSDCFYDGNCEPQEATEADIRETADYIRQAQELAR
jgi:hypothetical protein